MEKEPFLQDICIPLERLISELSNFCISFTKFSSFVKAIILSAEDWFEDIDFLKLCQSTISCGALSHRIPSCFSDRKIVRKSVMGLCASAQFQLVMYPRLQGI